MSGNIENKIFDLGEQGNKVIYFRGTGTPWKGLNIKLMILVNIEMKSCKCCRVYRIMHIKMGRYIVVGQSSSLQMKVCEFCINC